MNTCTKNVKGRREFILTGGLLVCLAVVIAIVIWQTYRLNKTCDNDPESAAESENGPVWPLLLKNLELSDDITMRLNNGSAVKLTVNLATDSPRNASEMQHCKKTNYDASSLCLERPGELKLTIRSSHIEVANSSEQLECYDVIWEALRSCTQILTDCINTTQHHWYGGYADKFQYWPFQKNTRRTSAYLVNDSYIGEIGGVVERYFISSSGVGILVDHNVPLYFSLNFPTPDLMCFSAKCDIYPYIQSYDRLPILRYKICVAENVKDVHMKMSNSFLDRPTTIPNERLFKFPIWSTWAQFHKNINQEKVINFAVDILKHDFTHAQIEIDDDWTPAYGEMSFNVDKFPDPLNMMNALKKLGFYVTVWIHPFMNLESEAFKEADNKGYLMKQFESNVVAMTPWWDGRYAGILDVSNVDATEWFLRRLFKLKSIYQIDSYKFDAGETSWLPHMYSANSTFVNPADTYPVKWVELAARADPNYQQEVRVGYKTQRFPLFVRMMDKMSNWGHDNALKSIIPCVLTYGILGYPFVLPDMIGGNAYNNHPDPELFIRWLQLNTFLPSMQFSIVPWMYNETIINLSMKFTRLHTVFSDVFIKYARVATRTGEPIIRPLWWLEPNHEDALTIEDQFLVGDEILVAPVVEAGARSRDIFIPSGTWQDQLRNKTNYATGPKWVRGYKVDIDELAYFIRTDER